MKKIEISHNPYKTVTTIKMKGKLEWNIKLN